MYRWTTIASESISVHDFPDLEQLFLGHGHIYRWATLSCMIFNSNSLAFIMPTESVPGDNDRFAVRQLNQEEIDDPVEKFAGILLWVQVSAALARAKPFCLER